MNTPASPLWTVQQQAWLRALGHTVWLYGSVQTALPLPKASQSNSAAHLQQPSAQLNSDHSPPISSSIQPVENSTPTPTPAVLPSILDPLALTLLRASGCNPNEPHSHRLIESWPLDQLRTDPAAKRALWPQLRALRRQQRQG